MQNGPIWPPAFLPANGSRHGRFRSQRHKCPQTLGNSPAAVQAASYLDVSLGDGFWLVLIGLLIIVGAIAKRFFITLAVLIVGVIVLLYVHAAWISSFVHQIGF
jgi:hypothetical protein